MTNGFKAAGPRRGGLTVRDFYGQTETTSQIGNPPGLAVKPGSMGLPLPGYRIRTLDADGREGDEGEVCIELDPKPTGLMLGYPSRTMPGLRRWEPLSIAQATLLRATPTGS